MALSVLRRRLAFVSMVRWNALNAHCFFDIGVAPSLHAHLRPHACSNYTSLYIIINGLLQKQLEVTCARFVQQQILLNFF